MNDLGAPILCTHDPFEGDGMIFGGIAAHDKNTVTVL
jgi:hypothetical protein